MRSRDAAFVLGEHRYLFRTLHPEHEDHALGEKALRLRLEKTAKKTRYHGLGILDAVVERNAYGRQVDSFETTLDAPKLGGEVPAVFIRAPRLLSVGKGVETLATHAGAPVLVRGPRVLAMTFHPELTGDSRLHRYFLDNVCEARAVAARAS